MKRKMTAKQKAAIEEAADTHITGYDHRCAYARHQGFIAGMQEVTEHPERYDLVPASHTAALRERVKELESDLDHHKRVIFSLQTDLENKKWFDVYEKDLIFLREMLERFEKSDRDVTQREYVEQMLKDWIAELEAK